MIYEIYTENGTKKKRALTGNGYGLPLGTWISYEGTCPDGFIESEQTFNTSVYSALYAMLGTNKVPARFDHSVLSDYENIGTGASLNTQGYNSSSNAFVCPYDGEVYFTFYSGTDGGVFAVHIIDSVGTDKKLENGSTATYNSKVFVLQVKKGDKIYSDDTRGIASYARWYKRHLAIKATPAYVEPDTVSDMVNTLRTQDSYSTSEVNTGKKWIDGKPIYRKCYAYDPFFDTGVNAWVAINTPQNVDTVVSCVGSSNAKNVGNIACFVNFGVKFDNNSLYIWIADLNVRVSTIVLEYTKTTDA